MPDPASNPADDPVVGPASDPGHGTPPGGGLSWSFELDLAELLAAIGRSGPSVASSPSAVHQPAGPPATASQKPASPPATASQKPADPPATAAGIQDCPPGLDPVLWADQDHQLAEERAFIEAAEADGTQPRDLTAVISDHVPSGPGLAAWLSRAEPDQLPDWDLPGIAAAYRRVASWAQAGELAAVAAISSRAAARDKKIGVDQQGRPASVSPAAAAEVSLGLVMSQTAASWWADLAVDLRWKLPATGRALAAGTIDLTRARLIVEALASLDDEIARRVEEQILPTAGLQTPGQLRAALRRRIIAADPDGADERRKNAERRAQVSLYPDHDGTAALVGSNLPGVHAAAAMARITALAHALKATGAGGGIDLLRAQVYLGLLLGTLPLIPPRPDAPPDPPGDRPPAGDPPAGTPPASPPPAGPTPADPPPSEDSPGGGPTSPRSGPPDTPGTSRASRGPADRARQSRRGEASPRPDSSSVTPAPPAGPPEASGPSGSSPPGPSGSSPPGPSGSSPPGPPPADSPTSGTSPPDSPPAGAPPAARQSPDAASRGGHLEHGPPSSVRDTTAPSHEPLAEVPPPDGPLPPGDGLPDDALPHHGAGGWSAVPGADDCCGDDADDGIELPWAPLPATVTQRAPAYGVRPQPAECWPTVAGNADLVAAVAGNPARRRPGLLDLTIPWTMLTGQAGSPAQLSRLGPVTAAQALPLARLAALDPHATWRVILTSESGQALAVERVYRRDPRQASHSSDPGHPDRPGGTTGRVTVTMPLSAARGETTDVNKNTTLGEPAGLREASGLRQAAGLREATGLREGAGLRHPVGSREATGSRESNGTPAGQQVPGIGAAIRRAAGRAAARAEESWATDAAGRGDCPHTIASASYRPPPRLREFIEARDQTCRHPRCRQPARQADLDHTIPFDQGGPTCACNLGPECRTHHQIKQERGWKLTQPRAGRFELTTPAGRTYITEPDAYPV